MNKYVRNYLLSVLNTIINLAFPIITFPYVSRVLGPTNLGIINFAQSYGYYFTHIASFGINSYAIREVSKVRADKVKVEKISNELFNLNLFFSLTSTLLYFGGVIFVDTFQEYFGIFAIYSIVIFSNFLTLDWLLQSFDDYYFSTIRNLLIRCLSLASVFVFVRKKEDFVLYMVISCVAEMGTKVSTLFYCRRNYAKLRIRKVFLNFKEHIGPMFTLFSFRLVNGISSNLDKLMIGFMMVYANVGIYSAGVKFALMMSQIVEIVGVVMFPKINILAEVQPEEYKKNLKINYDMILLLGVPMSIGMFLVSGRLIPWFAGDEYVDAIGVSRIMSVIILLGPLGDMLGSKTLLVFKKDKWLLYTSCIVAFSNILLNFLFIPVWGIYGAAAASVISYIVSVLLRYCFSRKLVKIRLLTLNLLKYVAFTIPFVIIYAIYRTYIDGNNFVMCVFVFGCAIIYLLELFLSRDYLLLMVIRKTIRKKVIGRDDK